MSLASNALLVATAMYVLCAVSCFRDRDWPHCLMWAGYCLANFGLIYYEFIKR